MPKGIDTKLSIELDSITVFGEPAIHNLGFHPLKRNIARFMLGILLLMGDKSQGAPQDSIDLNDFPKLEIQLLDNPFRVKDWIKNNWTTINRKKNPKAFVRAVFAYQWLDGLDSTFPHKEVEAAMSLAKKLGLYLEWTGIRFAVVDRDMSGPDAYEKTLSAYAKVLEDTRSLGSDQALAFALSVYANYLINYRQLGPAMIHT